jgi:hypothetical protein
MRSLPLFRPAAAAALLCIFATAFAAPRSAPHAAACVAALKAEETSLSETLKAGAPVEAELLKVVRGGIAIIGTQYLAGLQEAEARQLLESAEQDFRAMPPDAAKARQAQCLQEGESLYVRASPLEQSLITSAAQRRIRRLTSA